jgi:hypothetical protein
LFIHSHIFQFTTPAVFNKLNFAQRISNVSTRNSTCLVKEDLVVDALPPVHPPPPQDQRHSKPVQQPPPPIPQHEQIKLLLPQQLQLNSSKVLPAQVCSVKWLALLRTFLSLPSSTLNSY